MKRSERLAGNSRSFFFYLPLFNES